MRVNKGDVLNLIETVENLREELTLAQLKLEDQNWVNLSGGYSDKQMTTEEYLENHKACYQAYLTNPLAKRYVRYITYFVVGDGVNVVADEESVNEVLQGFWGDDDNDMEVAVKEMSDWLAICGEFFVRFFYDQYVGKTHIGLIDPSEIVHIETDPDNVKRHIAYHRKYRVQKSLEVQPDGSVNVEYENAYEKIDVQRSDGLLNAMHVKVGGVSNAVRGISDLLDIIVWMERYRQWLEDRALTNKIRNLFHYDVTIEGGNRQDIKDYLSKLKGREVKSMREDYQDFSTSERIRAGAIRVHSDKIKWDTVQPKVDASDAKEDGRAIKLMVAAGMGIPEHWLGDTGNTNLATAKALDLPTLRQFQDRQKVMRRALRVILKQVIACQREYGSLPKRPKGKDDFNDDFEIEFPPIEVEDLKAKADSFKVMTDAVMALINARKISEDTGNKILRQYEPLIREWEGEGGEQEKIEEENPEAKQQRVELPSIMVPPGLGQSEEEEEWQ
ncbi:MAG: phage portal protein [Actinomycetota bacterium]